MKKLLLWIGIMAFCVNLSIAQTITAGKSPETKAKKETAAVKLKKDGTADKRYTSTVPTGISDKQTNPSNAVLKKDGTPDKRYTSKASTATVDDATPTSTANGVRLNKDGTPDKRYTSQVLTTSNSSTVKLKKDGTPDKRYSITKETTVVTPTSTPSVNKPNVSNINSSKDYTPTVDRSLKGPNGEEILTGPRGGKYYINKNGNKTYIKR